MVEMVYLSYWIVWNRAVYLTERSVRWNFLHLIMYSISGICNHCIMRLLNCNILLTSFIFEWSNSFIVFVRSFFFLRSCSNKFFPKFHQLQTTQNITSFSLSFTSDWLTFIHTIRIAHFPKICISHTTYAMLIVYRQRTYYFWERWIFELLTHCVNWLIIHI